MKKSIFALALGSATAAAVTGATAAMYITDLGIGETLGTQVLTNYAISVAHKGCRSGTGTVANDCSDR